MVSLLIWLGAKRYKNAQNDMIYDALGRSSCRSITFLVRATKDIALTRGHVKSHCSHSEEKLLFEQLTHLTTWRKSQAMMFSTQELQRLYTSKSYLVLK